MKVIYGSITNRGSFTFNWGKENKSMQHCIIAVHTNQNVITRCQDSGIISQDVMIAERGGGCWSDINSIHKLCWMRFMQKHMQGGINLCEWLHNIVVLKSSFMVYFGKHLFFLFFYYFFFLYKYLIVLNYKIVFMRFTKGLQWKEARDLWKELNLVSCFDTFVDGRMCCDATVSMFMEHESIVKVWNAWERKKHCLKIAMKAKS